MRVRRRAAKAMASKKGVGRSKHIDLKYLRLQEQTEKDLKVTQGQLDSALASCA